MPKREDGKYENYAGKVFETREDYLIWLKEIAEKDERTNQYLKLSKEERDFLESVEEQAYRRGYSQGFYTARNNPDVSFLEVNAWRYSDELTHPPGSLYEGKNYSNKPDIDDFIEMID